MAAQCRRAALLDGRHNLELTETQVSVLRLAPGWPVGAEDVRDLQDGTKHGRDLGWRKCLQRADDRT